jgi:hypothetical protein
MFIVFLHRVSKKKKKKIKNNEPEMWIRDLSNILFRGELYHKGSWQWNKRYCVISDNRLLVYKTEKSARPFINFVLLGYQIVYIEKEGRRNHVIRIAHQGCESHFFAADLKEIADLWLEVHISSDITSFNPIAFLDESSKMHIRTVYRYVLKFVGLCTMPHF